jgi:D-alanyl-D-alanine carboxypeptidase
MATSESVATADPSAPEIPASAWARFDSLIGQALLPGNRAASVAVSIHGVPVYAGAFGTRTGDASDPVTITDRFRLASISKVVTATVVLQLVARGELELDEPVGLRLAAIAGVTPGDALVPTITVRQLLSHTSGFPDYRSLFFGDRFRSCEEAAAYGLARPVAHQPGTEHDYSNLNYCLLSLLVADVTGVSYERAATDQLLIPLGIDGMRMVRTVDPDPDEVVHQSGASRTYMESLAGAGAWVATATDVVRILDSLDSTTPLWHALPPELVLQMVDPLDVRYPEPNVRRYGLGIIVWPDGTFGHTGTVENTHAMLVHRPDGVTWCILVSGDRPDSTESLRELFDGAIASAGVTFSG